MFLRTRMYFMLRKIDKAFYAEEFENDDSAYPKLMQYIFAKPSRKKIVYALADVDAVCIDKNDDGTFEMIRGSRSHIYLLERSEICMNRAMAFLSGVGVTLVAEGIIRHFF